MICSCACQNTWMIGAFQFEDGAVQQLQFASTLVEGCQSSLSDTIATL